MTSKAILDNLSGNTTNLSTILPAGLLNMFTLGAALPAKQIRLIRVIRG